MSADTNKLRVFISSTCFDLLDLRTELRTFLEENGFSVALSEDAFSPFLVDPTADSIASCINNVESSDVLLCILDGRYGTPLTTSQFTDLSATHAEIRKARDIGRPIFYFIREFAWLDYQQLKIDQNYKSKWVEKKNDDGKRRWFGFVDEVASLPKTHSLSNWCDTFRSSVDLKPLVLKRLLDHFPDHIGAKAMLPDRLVRLHFVHETSELSGKVYGHFRNVGVGPALDIYHGYRIGNRAKLVCSRGALGEKENIKMPNNMQFCYELPPEKAPALFCEYSNRFGDRYRVEVILAWEKDGYMVSGDEKFFPVSKWDRIV